MKTLAIIFLCLLSFALVAKETYEPPTSLTKAEATKTRTESKKNKNLVITHWKNRLALAKLNNQKLAKPGMPLQRPYYGDHVVAKP